jgi:hypothetical protein
MWNVTYMMATYLPVYVVKWLTLCIMLGMTTRKNHPNGLKSGMEKFSTMLERILGKNFLNHHSLPLHDHFGEFLLGFAHSTKL